MWLTLAARCMCGTVLVLWWLGPLLTSVMRHFMSSTYQSYVTPGEAEAKGHELFEHMRACQDKEEKRVEQFWEQVSTQAEEARERKKQSKQEEEQ